MRPLLYSSYAASSVYVPRARVPDRVGLRNRLATAAQRDLGDDAYAQSSGSAGTRMPLSLHGARAGRHVEQTEFDRHSAIRLSARWQRRQLRQRRMEPLWSPVVATGGNQWQMERPRNWLKNAKTFAAGCDRLPSRAHGKGRVDPTSLLLKRGSLSWLRKENRVPQTRRLGATRTATLTGQLELA